MAETSHIIGSGLAGLLAAQALHSRGVAVTVLSSRSAGTRHMSGVFDWLNLERVHPATGAHAALTIPEAMTRFCDAHPRHVLSHPFGLHTHLEAMWQTVRPLFDALDCPLMHAWPHFLTSLHISGKTSHVGAALPGMALLPAVVAELKNARVISFPGCPDYSMAAVAHELGQWGLAVELIPFSAWRSHPQTPTASLYQWIKEPGHRAQFLAFLKQHIHPGDLCVLPPFQLINSDLLEWQRAVCDELKFMWLSPHGVMPSRAGDFFITRARAALMRSGVEFVDGHVVRIDTDKQRATHIHVDLAERATVFPVQQLILATGRLQGGGLHLNQEMSEALLQLPLVSGSRVMAHQHVNHLIDADRTHAQELFEIGVAVDSSFKPIDPMTRCQIYENISICGHLAGGFDPVRDGCGFGVTAASIFHLLSAKRSHIK